MIAGRIIAVLMIALATAIPLARGTDEKAWSLASYNVHLHVAIDSSANPGAIPQHVIAQLERQIHRNLYPFWRCEITAHSAAKKNALLEELDQLESTKEHFESGADKTIFLTALAQSTDVRLACREHDTVTGRWTPTIVRHVRQELLLPQACFELVCDAFAPRALVLVDPQKNNRVTMLFRGAALLPESNRDIVIRPRAAFQAYLIRTNRSGATVGNAIDVPWTYLVTEEPKEAIWTAEVYSGTRRPFGARSRAGIDVMALELKPSDQGTIVRFHAGHDPQQALAGYEVFEKPADAKEFQPAGFTDESGEIRIKRGDFPISLVALRADAQPLVQVPVAPGTVAELQIPVSDDIARLRVQESLTTFREQMVDVVARRNILMARARDRMKKGKRQEAKQLLGEIGDLPTRANMDRFLATLERDPGSHSENPRVQAKIDRLFADSRKMIGTYLTMRELLELETELNNSAEQGTE